MGPVTHCLSEIWRDLKPAINSIFRGLGMIDFLWKTPVVLVAHCPFALLVSYPSFPLGHQPLSRSHWLWVKRTAPSTHTL